MGPASLISGAGNTVGFACEADTADVASLLRALDAYYRPGEILPLEEDYVALVAKVLAEREGTRFVLARGNGEPLGLACISVLRPGRDLKGLIYLKDLFVVEQARGHGVGRRLMRFLAGFAVEQGIGRIDFTTDRSNEAAQRFYASLGARVQQKVCYSLPGEALRGFADEAAD